MEGLWQQKGFLVETAKAIGWLLSSIGRRKTSTNSMTHLWCVNLFNPQNTIAFFKFSPLCIFMRKLIAMILLLALAGCVQKPVTEITLPGHGQQIYAFANDIREALKVPTNDPAGIKALFDSSSKVAIVFNGSSPEDNRYFQVVVVNTVTKLQAYYSYEGKLMRFDVYYYDNEGWHNSTGGAVLQPLNGAAIWLLGPNTGAAATSVALERSVVYVQGTGYKELTLAADRLSLAFMGIERI